MATLYSTNTTLQDILNMRVGDELRLSGDELPDYTEEDAGKMLQVNSTGSGLEWKDKMTVLSISDEFHSMFTDVMGVAVPGAIASGLGVPYYVTPTLSEFQDSDSWDAYTDKVKQTVENKGSIVVEQNGELFYPVSVYYNEDVITTTKKFVRLKFMLANVTFSNYTFNILVTLESCMESGVRKVGFGGSFTVVNGPNT